MCLYVVDNIYLQHIIPNLHWIKFPTPLSLLNAIGQPEGNISQGRDFEGFKWIREMKE